MRRPGGNHCYEAPPGKKSGVEATLETTTVDEGFRSQARPYRPVLEPQQHTAPWSRVMPWRDTNHVQFTVIL